MILISGVGLLLLCLTNRIARVIDRARIVAADCHVVGADELETCYVKLGILSQRTRVSFDGCPVVISTGGDGVILSVSTFYSAWKLRKYSSAVLPVVNWLNASRIPLTLRVAGAVSVPLRPKSGLLARLFAPSLANG